MMDFQRRKITHSSLHDMLCEPNVRIEDIQEFLDRRKYSINEVDQHGNTPLLVALQRKTSSANIIKLLLQYGGDVKFKDKLGSSLLMVALISNCDETVVKVLLEALDATTVNEVDPIQRDTPLSFAVRKKLSVYIIKHLLNHGADVKFRNKRGYSLLMLALRRKYDATVVKVLLEALQEALDATTVNEVDPSRGDTPLSFAVKYNFSVNIVKHLLNYGADFSFKDRNGSSLLIVALRVQCDETVMKVLLETLDATSVNEIDPMQGYSPLAYAVKNNNSVNLIKQLLKYGADVKFRDKHGSSLLMVALRKNCDETVVKVLLEALDATAVNEVDPIDKIPPLFYTLKTANCSVNIVKLLLQFGADVGFRDVISGNSISLASRDEATVKLLIKYSCLKIKKFDVRPLLQDNEGYEDAASFAANCAQEVKKMVSVKVSRGRTLHKIVSDNSLLQGQVANVNEKLKTILNKLLEKRIDVACPIYLDMILVKVKKQVMVAKLQEVMLHLVTNFNFLSGLSKVLLNYGCACKLAQHLRKDELLNLILAFYIPRVCANSRKRAIFFSKKHFTKCQIYQKIKKKLSW